MSLLDTIKRLFGFSSNGNGSSRAPSPGDRRLNCEDCEKEFIFDVGEQRFFKSKGFTDPKRCPICRKKVKTHIRKRFRGGRNRHQSSSKRNSGHSLIDGSSPYADER